MFVRIERVCSDLLVLREILLHLYFASMSNIIVWMKFSNMRYVIALFRQKKTVNNRQLKETFLVYQTDLVACVYCNETAVQMLNGL